MESDCLKNSPSRVTATTMEAKPNRSLKTERLKSAASKPDTTTRHSKVLFTRVNSMGMTGIINMSTSRAINNVMLVRNKLLCLSGPDLIMLRWAFAIMMLRCL